MLINSSKVSPWPKELYLTWKTKTINFCINILYEVKSLHNNLRILQRLGARTGAGVAAPHRRVGGRASTAGRVAAASRAAPVNTAPTVYAVTTIVVLLYTDVRSLSLQHKRVKWMVICYVKINELKIHLMLCPLLILKQNLL